MISPVIICGDKSEAAGRTRQGTFAPAQPCATRDSAQIKPTCVAGETHPHGIAGVRELVTVRIATLVAGERIVATIRCSKRPNSPASFQSAHTSRAVTAGVLSVISAPLRLQYKLREMSDVRGSVYRALMLGRHAYGLAADAGQQAYQHEKVLADARNSKLAGLAAAVAGPQRKG